MAQGHRRDAGARILLVDDELLFCRSLGRVLQRFEPTWQVDYVATPDEALSAAAGDRYDIVVVDWNLGHASLTGLDVCETLQRRGTRSAVVILSANDAPNDRVAAIAAGAEDYIPKQVGTREIHARIKVAVARGPTQRRALQVGRLQIDLVSLRATIDERSVELSKHQWLLLARLTRRTGEIVAVDELCRFAGIEPGPSFKNLSNEVQRLRRRLEGAGVLVVAVRGLGYLLREDAEEFP